MLEIFCPSSIQRYFSDEVEDLDIGVYSPLQDFYWYNLVVNLTEDEFL
jgi:hypothetical protein